MKKSQSIIIIILNLIVGIEGFKKINQYQSYKEKYGNVPDLVVSGFHLMKKSDYRDSEIEEIKAIANELKDYPTKFVTCHCTGTAAYDVMKNIMGDSLEYVHSGEEVVLD